VTTATGHFIPGTEFIGGSRTVTDAEISFLPALMGAISPLFHDDVTARASAMGGRILYGPALLGISIALTESLLRDRVRGLVEISSVRFRRPVFTGDTVTARFTVRDCQAREGKAGMLLNVDDEVRNQDDEVVLRFARTVLIAHND
jgi:acyl dehydratase